MRLGVVSEVSFVQNLVARLENLTKSFHTITFKTYFGKPYRSLELCAFQAHSIAQKREYSRRLSELGTETLLIYERKLQEGQSISLR